MLRLTTDNFTGNIIIPLKDASCGAYENNLGNKYIAELQSYSAHKQRAF
jgi:hypothetical protein